MIQRGIAILSGIQKSKRRRLPWFQALQNLLVPPVCIGCEKAIDEQQSLLVCADCQTRALRLDLKRMCIGCSARLRGEPGTVESCYYCKDLKMPFSSVTSIANYEGLLREWVVQMKSSHGQSVGIQMGLWLAKILAVQLDDDRIQHFDFITPMPAHWTRRLKRGFSVSGLVAESICQHPKLTGKSSQLLITNRKTRKQGTLTMAERFDNVKNCFTFSGKPDISGASILLVDDVMTSGATAIQAANVLKQAGARQVHLAIVARGIGRQP